MMDIAKLRRHRKLGVQILTEFINATPETVDTVLRSVARLLPVIGAFTMTDLSGVDVLRDVHRNIQPHLDHRPEPSPLLDKMIAEGKLGVKSGEGFYRWSPEQVKEIRGLAVG